VLAIAREGRLSAASKALGIDGSTVGRRLSAAEERFGAQLFTRDLDGFRPTDVGLAAVEAAEEIERKVLSLFQETRQTADSVCGPVRITSVDALLSDWLVPRLPRLLEVYPLLEIKLIPENRVLSFSRGEADLALRLSRPVDDAAIRMRRVAKLGAAVYGHKKFAHLSPEDWGKQHWLTYNDDLSEASPMRWITKVAPDALVQLRSSSTSILLEACKAGLGIALLPCIAVKDGSLARLSGEDVPGLDIWLLSHRETARIKRFKVVAAWIADQMTADWSFLADGDQ
jgi:DNA-binding transcriptional LysR family regulator